MKDSTIVTLSFVGLCALILICLTVLKLCGYDGTITKCLIAIAAVCFCGNFYSLLRSRKR